MTTILRSYRVQPSNDTNEIRKQQLEGLDKNNYSYTTIFFGYSKPTVPYEHIIEKIKRDLSILQNDFPMIAGHVQYNYELNDAQLICDGGGVVVVEAENNTIRMDDLGIQNNPRDMKATHVVSSFFTPDMKALKEKFNVQHLPLVVQVTKLKCGSIVLTTLNSHMLMDGTTFELVQKAWKQISRGELENIATPDEDKKLDYAHIELESEKPKGWMEIPKQFLFQEPAVQSQPTPSCRFHFSKEKVDELKEELNALLKQDGKYVTTNEIISTILWKAVIKHRKLTKDQETTFVRPTNFRGLLKPMLSENSVGNLALMNGVTLTVDQVLSSDILEIIKEIQAQQGAYNKEKILQNLKYFTELPSDKCLIMDIAGMRQNDVFINAWSKFKSLTSFDIGFGNNIFACNPPLFDGAIIVYPTCHHHVEGFVAHASLSENVLQEMLNDNELLKFLIQ
jgi:hypothetical protein